MDIKQILGMVDHTLLHPSSTGEEIKNICDEAIKHKTASVCIPPSFVSMASKYVAGKTAICTVIGFPNGYNTLETKVFETFDAIKNGADEIDMVVNLGDVKNNDIEKITKEIKEIKKACGDKILKVIIEACLLNENEKTMLCKAVTDAGADFIKTSTGFSTGGATLEDIKLFANNIGKNVKIKAAGGIKTINDAENFINAGANRLGTSSIVKILENKEGAGY